MADLNADRLAPDFYLRDDVIAISRELLGAVLCTRVNGEVCRMLITETEAYAGEEDRASHAYGGRRTRRTEVMYGEGGRAYVYLCYGIHHLFNVVTNVEGIPHAVLVRAGEPLAGTETILHRRGKRRACPALLPGPGTVGQGMGITTEMSGESLLGNTVWIEPRPAGLGRFSIESGPRIGVDYAGDDAALPYRFVLRYESFESLPSLAETK